MKIVHMCLCGPVTDGWSYQDNMISKFHVQLGYEVSIITSQWVWGTDGKMYLYTNTNYVNENGVKMHRLSFNFGTNINSKIKLFSKVYITIANEAPDIIFIHGCQFWDIRKVVKYLKKHSDVKVYVDNHADFSNSATNWLSKNILHKIVWRYCAKIIEPFTTKFYGVLPARVNFLKGVYKIPPEKTELLLMGADDEKVAMARSAKSIKQIRNKHNIANGDFLIVTGGKIDPAKSQTILLMEAVKRINFNYVKLILFGSITNDLKDKIISLIDNDKIQYIGWIDPDEAYNYFAASDLAVFPGRHSVLWEQVVGTGIPCVFKRWEGTTHVDIGGNCRFIDNDSIEEIERVLLEILDNNDLYNQIHAQAQKGIKLFSYKDIAERSIKI